MTDDQPVQWTVHFGRLQEAANGATEVAGILRGKIEGSVTDALGAASHHEDWASGAALKRCGEAWARHLHTHAENAHGLGVDLDETHAFYRRAKKDAEDGVDSVRNFVKSYSDPYREV